MEIGCWRKSEILSAWRCPLIAYIFTLYKYILAMIVGNVQLDVNR